jgi:hypothetical protein
VLVFRFGVAGVGVLVMDLLLVLLQIWFLCLLVFGGGEELRR